MCNVIEAITFDIEFFFFDTHQKSISVVSQSIFLLVGTRKQNQSFNPFMENTFFYLHGLSLIMRAMPSLLKNSS